MDVTTINDTIELLKKAEALALGLPAVQNRRELKVKADEIARLTEMAMRKLHRMKIAEQNKNFSISPANHGHCAQPRE